MIQILHQLIKAVTEGAPLPDTNGYEECDSAVRTAALRSLLGSNKPIHDVFMKCTDVVIYFFPEIAPCVGFDHNSFYHQHDVFEHMLYVTDHCAAGGFTVRLAALLHDIGKPACCMLGKDGYNHYHGHPEVSFQICKKMLPQRLELNDQEMDEVLWLIRAHDARISADVGSIQAMISTYGAELTRKWLLLKRADVADHINMTVGRTCTDLDLCDRIYRELTGGETE